jgi:hypothetical protein
MTVTEGIVTGVYPSNLIFELYSMLIGSPYVVTVEDHLSEDKQVSEFRVIFWSQDSYDKWASIHRTRYDFIVNQFNQVNDTGVVKFERYTSHDNYTSKFPYTNYPDKNNMIDWVLIPFHKQYVIDNIVPIGKLQDYTGNGNIIPFVKIKNQLSRFIKERTSDIVRRPLSAKATNSNNFNRIIAYSFEQAVLTCLYPAPWLFRKLQKLSDDVENYASTFISDCDNAAVLVGHQSLGDEMTVHTHRLSDIPMYSFTVAVRLTFSGKGAKCKFYEPLSDDDPNLPNYYSNPLLLYQTLEGKIPNEFSIDSRASVLVFSGSYIPHNVEYNDDIFLYYVYDNVTFKDGMLDTIKEKSQHTYPSDDNKGLYFFSITN